MGQGEEWLATEKEKSCEEGCLERICYLSSRGTASSRPLQRKGSWPYSPSCFEAIGQTQLEDRGLESLGDPDCGPQDTEHQRRIESGYVFGAGRG